MDDLEYYRRRLEQEEVAVRRATSKAARERHRELAEAYRLCVRVAIEWAGRPPQRASGREIA